MPSGGPSYGSYCCVSWCFNNGRTHKKPGTSFFRVPRDGRMKAWMQYAGRDDLLVSRPAYCTQRTGFVATILLLKVSWTLGTQGLQEWLFPVCNQLHHVL
ncbi:uncharacterized protein LOC142814649 isoform X3 [Rhipicephalus microplus]|uniref:uncharacterized protein LOC142814649 isoform X3 n=1 Tax=Rhipicephalus microplus TaxID=6941 RepID=UPI003F6D0C48